MNYLSTRHGSQGSPAPLGFEDVMLAGLARDGGLYLPAEWPQFSKADIAAMKGKCPNCGGELVTRPRRPADKLVKYPASTQRVLKKP